MSASSNACNEIGSGTSALQWPSCALIILHCWQNICTVSDAGTLPLVHTATALMRQQSTWCYSAQLTTRSGATSGQEESSVWTLKAYGTFLNGSGRWPAPPLTGNERESEHVGPAIVRSLTQVVTAWMGDCRSVNHLGNNQHQDQLCLPALCGREIEHLLVWLRLRQGMFTCVGWQVLLCDPVWQVTLGFFEMGFLWKLKKRAECLALCWFGGK